METAHIKTILTEVAQAAEKDGWFEAPEGKTLTLYAGRDGSTVSAPKVISVRLADELVHARTMRGETYIFYLVDIFAAVVEGTAEASKRKAGFVLARRGPAGPRARGRVSLPLLLAALALALWWPWALARPLGWLLGLLAGRGLGIRRREVKERMLASGVEAPDRAADAMYASLGAGVFELLWTLAPGPRSLASRVRLTARAERALGQVRGLGAVVATAHTGNWDLAACAVAERAPLWVVSKRLRVRWLDRLWQALRRRRGVRVVDARGALSAGRLALRSGGLVAMIIDQAPERRGGVLRAPFLGRDAWHDLAPATLAARERRPLALALARRLDDGSHEVDVPLLLWPPDRPGRAWIEHATRAASEALEAHVRRWPAQWLWLHRRWKPLPARRGASIDPQDPRADPA